MTSSALAALLAAVALWGPASGAGPALVRFQEVAASFKPATGTPSGFATLGTYHSCKWSGAPDRLEDFLLASQMQDPVRARCPRRRAALSRPRGHHAIEALLLRRPMPGAA